MGFTPLIPLRNKLDKSAQTNVKPLVVQPVWRRETRKKKHTSMWQNIEASKIIKLISFIVRLMDFVIIIPGLSNINK